MAPVKHSPKDRNRAVMSTNNPYNLPPPPPPKPTSRSLSNDSIGAPSFSSLSDSGAAATRTRNELRDTLVGADNDVDVVEAAQDGPTFNMSGLIRGNAQDYAHAGQTGNFGPQNSNAVQEYGRTELSLGVIPDSRDVPCEFQTRKTLVSEDQHHQYRSGKETPREPNQGREPYPRRRMEADPTHWLAGEATSRRTSGGERNPLVSSGTIPKGFIQGCAPRPITGGDTSRTLYEATRTRPDSNTRQSSDKPNQDPYQVNHGVSEELKTVINSAVVQAYDFYNNSLKEEITESLKVELRRNFLEFLGGINRVTRPEPPLEARSPKPVVERNRLEPSHCSQTFPRGYPQRDPSPGQRSKFGDPNRRSDWENERSNGMHQPTYFQDYSRYAGNPPGEYYPPPGYQSHTSVRGAIKIDKWGLKFDGTMGTVTVEDFIFRLETLRSQYDCSWAEILRDFHLLLSGAASEWYWQFQRSNYRPDWSMLRDALMRQFRNSKSDLELVRDIMDRRQGTWESSDEYFGAISKLKSQLRMQIAEEELVRILKKNLNERIGRLVYPQSIFSLDQLRMACRDAENAFPSRDRDGPRQQRPPTRYLVNEVEYGEDVPGFQEEHLAAFQPPRTRERSVRNYSDVRPLICWNCRKQGHSFMDCPASTRSIFCYRCGQEGVITPKCHVCNPGNRQRDATSSGESRSTQTPQQE